MPEQVQSRFDRDRVALDPEQVVRRRELGVDLPRPVEIARGGRANLGRDLRPDDVRVHADAPEAAELEERLNEIVVSRVEVEPGVDDVPRLGEVGVRLLHRAHRSISASRLIVSGSMLTTTRAGML